MTIKSAGNDESHIRPGEVQVALPAEADASLYFIGRIRTPWTARKDCPKNARASRESGVVCTIEVDPRWQQALPGVETCSHLIVLYWMDRARRDLAVQVPEAIRRRQADLFAALAGAAQPDRARRGRASQGRGQHASTSSASTASTTRPLLDIKPYFTSTDAIADARVGWHADTQR